MALPALQKGEPLVLVSEDRNASAEEVVVSRIGLVYVYVTRKGAAYEDDTKFDRVTGAAKQNIGWARTLVTPAQYAEMKEREQLLADLKDAGVNIEHRHRDTVPLAKLRGLLAVMKEDEGPAPATRLTHDPLPRVGRRFWHAHKVVEDINPDTGKRDPELCKITKITAGRIYYRVGIDPADGSGGGSWYSEVDRFPGEVLRWAYDTETKYARLLACGLCFEENGEEVHPHPECPMPGGQSA